MAETSCVELDCAVRNGGSKQTATSASSSLIDLLTEIKNTKQQQDQILRNGNNLPDEDDKPLDLKNSIKKKKSLSSNSHKTNSISKSNTVIITTSTTDILSSNDDRQTTINDSSFTNDNNNSTKNQISKVHHNQKEIKSQNSNPKEATVDLSTSIESLSRGDIVFRIGFKLEACDLTGTWCPAKITAINEKDKTVLIHFIRWSKKFDEWMSMSSDQIRALTKRDDEDSEAESQKSSFSVGKLVLASWSDNKKYPGQVLSVTSDGNYNILFLDGYRKKVKKSLVEPVPDDYQINFNFNPPIVNSTTIAADSTAMLTNNITSLSTSNSTKTTLDSSSTTNGSNAAITPLLAPHLTSTSTSTISRSTKKRSVTDHLIASKEFVVTEDHNQFKCEVEQCNKSFRKEKLLNSHIKYYHEELYKSEEYKQKRLELERDQNTFLDESLSNELSSFNSSRRTTINENSNTSWNSESATPKNKSSVIETIAKNKEPTTEKSSGRTLTSIKNQLNSTDDSPISTMVNDRPGSPLLPENSSLTNGRFEPFDSKQSSSMSEQATPSAAGGHKIRRSRPSSKSKKQQSTEIKNSSKCSSPTLLTPRASNSTPSIAIPDVAVASANSSKSNRLSNQTDSIAYASDSTIEDSISSFDSPLTIACTSESNIDASKATKRGRAPGKRKIKERVYVDCYIEDSNSLSTIKPSDKSTTPTPTNTKRKYRPKKNNTKNCLNKELLELKIELQEKQSQRIAEGRNDEDDGSFNLFFTNTPSTSSASESAFAENAELGTDFHNYERRHRDPSPSHPFDDFAQSPTNSSYLGDSLGSSDKKKKKASATFNRATTSLTTSKRQRLVASEPMSSRNVNSPTFLNTPIAAGGYSTPSRKQIVLRDGFVFSATNDLSSSNVSPLSLHALEKPVPNTVLPFWNARYVREIHESDDVDEEVHCICDFKEESGLMVQCECCLCWSHGSCFDIEVEEKVPESYVCFACKESKMVRESERYIYDQEWLKKGKHPCFDLLAHHLPSDIDVRQSADSIKQTLITNQLLSILIDASQILRSLRHKMNLIKENNVKEMKFWESHIDEELIQPPAQQAPESDAFNNEDEFVKEKILDQNMTENEMIGDILNFSDNILDNEQTDADNKSIPDYELNNDLDGATDLIDFITAPAKESDTKELNNSLKGLKKELDNNLDFNLNHARSSTTSHQQSTSFAIDIKNEALIDETELSVADSKHNDDTKTKQKPTLEERLLEHINSVHLNLMRKLELAERKIAEIENEFALNSDLNGLRHDLNKFKDGAKYLYVDLQNVNRFATI